MNFSTGIIVMTPGVEENMGTIPGYGDWASKCLERHMNCDWGDLCPEDREMNDEAVRLESEGKMSDRILSSYKNGTEKLWIITECDRSCTTLLLPEEY